jgi:hypothetical protein
MFVVAIGMLALATRTTIATHGPQLLRYAVAL